MVHLVLYVWSWRFLWNVHVDISSAPLGISINSIASGMDVRIEDHQLVVPLDCHGGIEEGHPTLRAGGWFPGERRPVPSLQGWNVLG